MKSDGNRGIENHPVVSHDEWMRARTQFLAKEKEFTALRDEVSRQRRELPWVSVVKDYVFQGADGKQNLSELFDGRSQLIVYHFMFAPDWDAGCRACSFWADNFNPIVIHLNHRDVSLIAVSRAKYKTLSAYARRMGWTFKWVSSHDTDFNFDYNVSFTPAELSKKKALYNFKIQDPHVSDQHGITVFYKDATGNIFRTYSTHARGIDLMNTAYNYLDLTPKGRAEDGRSMHWLRRRDEY